MSRTIEELSDGTYHEEIADYDACRHMYNEVCCNDKSEWLADYPGEYCEECPYFEVEDNEG